MDEKELENRFTYHAPKGDQPATYESIRDRGWNMAIYLSAVCPDCRELSIAVTKIEEAVMWANAAIARHA